MIATTAAAALSVMAVSAGAIPPPEAGGQVPAVGGALRPSPVTRPLDLAGQRRYIVKVLHFRAIDESGADWIGSDEVFGLFGATGGSWVRTRSYGDVDSGDYVRFPSDEQCLAPQRVLSGSSPYPGWLVAPGSHWDCDPRGVAAPLDLHLDLWEDDTCSAFLGCFNPTVPPVKDPADDLIGRVAVTYSASELASRLPHVGDRFGDTFKFGGPCGYQPPGGDVCGIGPLTPTGPEYELLVSVHRVDDAAPRFAPSP